jgi:hypothetical protein
VTTVTLAVSRARTTRARRGGILSLSATNEKELFEMTAATATHPAPIAAARELAPPRPRLHRRAMAAIARYNERMTLGGSGTTMPRLRWY